jgi:hypothetical protein
MRRFSSGEGEKIEIAGRLLLATHAGVNAAGNRQPPVVANHASSQKLMAEMAMPPVLLAWRIAAAGSEVLVECGRVAMA